jgi:UrcA family protein
MSTSRKIALFAALVLCTAGLPSLASAATPDDVQVSVPTADLDLTAPSGQRLLHKRIHRAALTACMNANQTTNELSEPMQICVEKAVRDAGAAVQEVIRVATANQAVSLQASAIPH